MDDAKPMGFRRACLRCGLGALAALLVVLGVAALPSSEARSVLQQPIPRTIPATACLAGACRHP